MAVRIDNSDYLYRTSGVLDQNAAYTIMYWLFLSADPGTWSHFHAIYNTDYWYSDWLGTLDDGTTLRLAARNGTSGQSAVTLGTDLSLSTWYHVAVVREDTSTLKAYLNSALDATASYDITGRPATDTIRYGAHSNGYYMDGRLFAIKEYQAALSVAEIQAEMYAIRPVRLSDLKVFYPLVTGGTRTTDYSGGGYNLTESGALTNEDGPPISWGGRIWLIPFAAAGSGTTYNQSAAGTLTPAGATIKRTGKPFTGTLTSAGAAVRRTGKVLTGLVTSAGVLAKRTGKIIAGTLSPIGAVVRRTAKNLAGTLTSSGALARSLVYVVSLAGTLTSAGTLTRRTAKGLAGTLTSSGALSRRVAKAVAGTVTTAGALVADFFSGSATYSQVAGGTLAAAGALARQTNKATSGALTMAGALARRIAKSFAGTLATVGAVVRSWTSPTAAKLDVTLVDARANTVTLVDTRANTVTLVDTRANTVTLGDATQ